MSQWYRGWSHHCLTGSIEIQGCSQRTLTVVGSEQQTPPGGCKICRHVYRLSREIPLRLTRRAAYLPGLPVRRGREGALTEVTGVSGLLGLWSQRGRSEPAAAWAPPALRLGDVSDRSSLPRCHQGSCFRTEPCSLLGPRTTGGLGLRDAGAHQS